MQAQNGPVPLTTSATARPLRVGQTPILQLDALSTPHHGSLVGLRSLHSTKVMQLSLSDSLAHGLAPDDLQCKPLFALEPRHTQGQHHIDFSFDHAHPSSTSSRALVMNTAGAVFQFEAGSEKATCMSVE